MEDYVLKSISILQMQFTKDTSSSPAGTTTLTNASTKIGQSVGRELDREPLPWGSQVSIGDLFIEALYNLNFIELSYAKTRNSCHIVSAAPRWFELGTIPPKGASFPLGATTTEKPKDIVKMFQKINGVDRPIIKGRLESDPLNKYAPWVQALNKLQQTAWTINKPVYDAMVLNREVFISEDPIEDNDAKELKRRSKMVEWAFISEKARKLSELDEFYQYLDVDYRGRFYYCESFMNYQGSDLARGLFKFKHAKPMTETGLQWLAIHTASVFNMSYGIDEIPKWCTSDYKDHLEREGLDNISVDKMTLEDRIEWTNQYMTEIKEAGKHQQFSSEAEKKVSFLAACVEWYEFDCAFKDNRIHMTSLPIPIDGSNNGWQHLGAISKDEQTGDLVGLIPSEIQKDFYVQTAKEMINICDDERLSSILAAMPMKSIRKGISKRGSMTRAYSAGSKKIAENMFFDCKSEDYHTEYGITQDDCTKFAKLLIKAIDKVCPGPLSTMTYLQDLSMYQLGSHVKLDSNGYEANAKYREYSQLRDDLMKKNFKTDEDLEELNDVVIKLKQFTTRLKHGKGDDKIKWSTPSGFDVIYEKWIMQDRKARGRIKGYGNKSGQVTHVALVPTRMPDRRGFICGMSPNYIHSMDASHMALVISEWNGCFAAVHDSFSTHASDVDRLLDLTKQVFIRMYDYENYFEVIRNFITDAEDDVEQPILGNLDIKEIENSDYFFA
jgi:DNA-directed RNA polymerase